MASRKIPSPRLTAHLERGEAFSAALDGNIKLLGTLLENGTAKVCDTEEHGATLLMAAAMGGHIHCVKMLLNRGAAVNARDALGRTALFYAIYNNKREAFDVLVSRDADCFAIDSDSMTPLHMAAARGCISISDKILALPNFTDERLMAKDAFDCTILHHATWRHHEDVFTKLIDASNRFPSVKVDFINARALDGSTALHYACQHKADSDDWVEILLDEKAERDACDNMGRSALHFAAMRDHSESVNVLLSDAMREDEIRADPKAVSSLAMLLQLRDRGLEQREGEESSEAYTALQIACVHGSIHSLGIMIEAFLQLQHYPEENKANRVNVRSIRDSEGRNALHLAAYMGQLEAAKRILGIFPDMKDSYDYKGRGCLFYCIKGMSDARARNNASTGQSQASEGEKEDEASTNSAILECACFQYLVREAGCDVTAEDHLRRTALHYASYYNELEVTRVLLSNSSAEQIAKWSQADVHGQTALHLAAEKGNAASLRLLILRGITVNGSDHNGKTALHLATENGHTQCVEILLQLGADPSIPDLKGRTPAHYAALLEGKRAEHSDPLVSAPLTASTMEGLNCFRRLMAESSDEQPMLTRDLQGITPFLVAVAGGSTETVRRMVEELEEKEESLFSLSPSLFSDASGWSPMHYAAFHGRLSCLQLLIEAFDGQKDGESVDSEWKNPMVEWADKEGVRPLHAAAQNARTSLMGVSLLLNHGANAYAVTKSGCSVLHVAASTGHQLLCQHLVSKHPDLLKKKDSNGDSARSVASHFGHAELAVFLKSCSSPARRESLPPVDIPTLGSSSPTPTSPSARVSSPGGSPSYGRKKGMRLLVASPLTRPRTSLEGGEEDFELDLGIDSSLEASVVHVSKIRPPTPLHSLKFSRLGKQLPPARAIPQLSPISHSKAVKKASAPLPPPLKRAATPVKSLSRSRLHLSKAHTATAATVSHPPPQVAPVKATPTISSRVELPMTPKQPELAVRTARSSSQRKQKRATPKTSRLTTGKSLQVTPRSATKKRTLVAPQAVNSSKRDSDNGNGKASADSNAKTSARAARLAYSEKLAKSGKKATTTAAKDVVVSSTMLSRKRAARAKAQEAANKEEENESFSNDEGEMNDSLLLEAPLPAPVLELFGSGSHSVKQSRSRGRSAIPYSEPRARRASIVATSKKAAVKEEVSFQARVLKARGKGADASEMLRMSAKRNRTACENLEDFDRRNHIDKLTSTPLAASRYREIREAAMGKSKSVERSTSASASEQALEAPSTPLFSSFQKRTTATESRGSKSSGRLSTAGVTPVYSSKKTPLSTQRSAASSSSASTVTPLATRSRVSRPATTQRVQSSRDEENASNRLHRSGASTSRKARPASVSRTASSTRATAFTKKSKAFTTTKRKTSGTSSSVQVSAAKVKPTAQKTSSVVSRLMNDAAKRRARNAEYEKSTAGYQPPSCFSTPATAGRRGRRAPASAR